MYAAAFGLAEEPFSIAPDPRFLFMSERHREALAHLLYGLRGGGGFVLLTGEVGAGKTTVARCFLEQIPRRCNVAYIFNPKLTVIELLQAVCEEFRIPVAARAAGGATLKDHVDALNRFLLEMHAVGRNNVLVIDEAQNLSADVLEQLRLLTNLETNERKLLQIILIGQPELRRQLARPELEQLAQRVIARYHLRALSAGETAQYVQHRLAVAGMPRPGLFESRALGRLHALARGVPRRINLLADRALLGAYATGRRRVDARTVERAAAEIFGDDRRDATRLRLRLALAGAIGVAAGAVLLFSLQRLAASRSPAASLAAAPAAGAASAAVAPAPASAASTTLVQAASAASAPAAPWPAVGDEAQALRELATQWNLAPGEADPCAAAARDGLRCFRGSGDLALLRRLDRPVVLELDGDAAAPAFVLLTGFSGDRVRLRAGGLERDVASGELAARWHGGFATFWRPPPGYAERPVQWRDPVAADWLARQLARAAGAASAAAAPASDAALVERVRAFQAAQGLPADGLAGPITLMQLNRAVGLAEPRLAGVGRP